MHLGGQRGVPRGAEDEARRASGGFARDERRVRAEQQEQRLPEHGEVARGVRELVWLGGGAARVREGGMYLRRNRKESEGIGGLGWSRKETVGDGRSRKESVGVGRSRKESDRGTSDASALRKCDSPSRAARRALRKASDASPMAKR